MCMVDACVIASLLYELANGMDLTGDQTKEKKKTGAAQSTNLSTILKPGEKQ